MDKLPLGKRNYMMNPDKFYNYMDRIWRTADEHGWHETPLSMEHHCGLIMTEMAEAVEADRNGRRARTEEFEELLSNGPKLIDVEKGSVLYKSWYMANYKNYVKGSIEEEFSDVIIRILDMACERHGKRMYPWKGYDDYGEDFRKDKSFVENAWYFIKEKLNFGTMNISDSISYMYAWADHLDINLDLHIEWKMKYNELRPYKHGGKKY